MLASSVFSNSSSIPDPVAHQLSLRGNQVTFYEPENKAATKTTIEENASPQDLIDSGFEQIEREVKDELLAKLKEVDPYAFEKLILILLKKMGYGDFVETSRSGDGGIDGIINEDQLGLEKIYIQAKRYNENKVRETDIRNFIGAMSGDTHKGIFVTTSAVWQSINRHLARNYQEPKIKQAVLDYYIAYGKHLTDEEFYWIVSKHARTCFARKQYDNWIAENPLLPNLRTL